MVYDMWKSYLGSTGLPLVICKRRPTMLSLQNCRGEVNGKPGTEYMTHRKTSRNARPVLSFSSFPESDDYYLKLNNITPTETTRKCGSKYPLLT